MSERWVPRPPSITVEEESGEVTYRRRWFHRGILGFPLFWIFCGGVAIGMYDVETAGGSVSIVTLLVAALTLLMVYSNIAHVTNTTTVRLGREMLTVRHGPLPWSGNVDLPTPEIRQLFCEETIRRLGRRIPVPSYGLYAVMADGRKVKVLSLLDFPDVPLYLEQRLERRLRIENEPVQGGLSRAGHPFEAPIS